MKGRTGMGMIKNGNREGSMDDGRGREEGRRSRECRSKQEKKRKRKG